MHAAPLLTHDQAKAFYDRLGRKQDWQAFYEDPATADLIAHADFDDAHAVFEFGCGTGRFARKLLADFLPTDCTYLAVDISTTMVGLARTRLEPWQARARVRQSPGSTKLDVADASVDRFLANYVLDLLSGADIRHLVAEAHRALTPDGRLCLTSLTHGRTPIARLVTWAWTRIHERQPALLGGCRPITLLEYAGAEHWHPLHHRVITRFGISSEILVASPH